MTDTPRRRTHREKPVSPSTPELIEENTRATAENTEVSANVAAARASEQTAANTRATAANTEAVAAATRAEGRADKVVEGQEVIIAALGGVSDSISTLNESTKKAIHERRRQNRLVLGVVILFALILVVQGYGIVQNRWINADQARSLRILDEATNPEAQARNAEATQRALDDIAQDSYRSNQEMVNVIAALLGKPAPQLTPPIRKVSAVSTTTTTPQPRGSTPATKGTAVPVRTSSTQHSSTTMGAPSPTSTTACQPSAGGVCVAIP